MSGVRIEYADVDDAVAKSDNRLTFLEGAEAKQPPGNPMGAFAARGDGQRPASMAQQQVNLDQDTKSILQEAARKARKSIFKSSETKKDAAE